jgi:gamma-glutamylcyclotransferase (GGCT)/AIG2-like uncharacterized protein YtfP
LITHVFVYGTLKPGEVNYSQYCQDQVISVRRAIVGGMLYTFPDRDYPAMVLGQGWVKGYVLTFPTVEILKTLDELEDYDPNRTSEQNEYQRCRVTVFEPEQQAPITEAWTYMMLIDQVIERGGIALSQGK